MMINMYISLWVEKLQKYEDERGDWGGWDIDGV